MRPRRSTPSTRPWAGRLILKPDPKWETQLREMNEGKRGRPFVYSDFLMGSIAYIRMMVGLSLRIMEGEVEGMFLLMGRARPLPT